MTKNLWNAINIFLKKKSVLITLLIINVLGSIYGFYWYKDQLLDTPKEWLIFVPDSPLATVFFSLFLILLLYNKKSSFIGALASITLFKYGVWTMMIIIWGAWSVEPSLVKILMVETITWLDVLLFLSHLGMALQALVFFKKYTYTFVSIFIVGIWIILNDFADYLIGYHPYLPETLKASEQIVGQYTVLLSGITLLIFYILSLIRRNKV